MAATWSKHMPDTRTQMPFFLDVEMAQDAVHDAVSIVMGRILMGGAYAGCYVLVIVPALRDEEGTGPQIGTAVLYEYSHKEEQWAPNAQYKKVAFSKANQLLHGVQPGNNIVLPHLMMEGETHYAGGVIRDGIVVACSGLPSWADTMLSGIAIEIMVGLSAEAYKQWQEEQSALPKAERAAFLIR